uniref:Putative secreted protein n=1 Tax=Anopheles darlingi TaxID=43151 RepID=A0A2M4DCX5_ANODA
MTSLSISLSLIGGGVANGTPWPPASGIESVKKRKGKQQRKGNNRETFYEPTEGPAGSSNIQNPGPGLARQRNVINQSTRTPWRTMVAGTLSSRCQSGGPCP